MVPSTLLIIKNRADEQTSFEEGPVQSSCTRSLNLAVTWCGWLFLPAVIQVWPCARLPTPAHSRSPYVLVDGGGEDLPARCPEWRKRGLQGCLCVLHPGKVSITILRASTPSHEQGKIFPVVGSSLIQPEFLYSVLVCFSCDICYFSFHKDSLRSGAQLKAQFAPELPLSWGWGVGVSQEQMLRVCRVAFFSSKLLFSWPQIFLISCPEWHKPLKPLCWVRCARQPCPRLTQKRGASAVYKLPGKLSACLGVSGGPTRRCPRPG